MLYFIRWFIYPFLALGFGILTILGILGIAALIYSLT